MANQISFNSSNYIAQRIAANMNIQDLTPQSKINVLVNGLLNEDTIFQTHREDSLRNFYIQTADEASLERIGVAEGVYRINTPILRVHAGDEAISLKKVTDYSETLSLEEGSKLELVSEHYWVVLLEDVDISNALSEKIFLSGDIKATTTETNLDFLEGVSYNVNINGDTYTVTFEKNLSIPVLEESLENYRSRIIYAKDSPRTGSESAVRLTIASNELITDYSVNFDTNPFEIVIFNHSLFNDDSDLDTLTDYALPVLETQLNLVKSEGSLYNTTVAKKVNISLVLKANVANPREVSPYWNTFKDFIYSLYKVGNVIEVSSELFKVYLTLQDVDSSFLSDYDFIIYKNFLGTEYLSDSKNIMILQDEYPFINEVRVE